MDAIEQALEKLKEATETLALRVAENIEQQTKQKKKIKDLQKAISTSYRRIDKALETAQKEVKDS